MRKILIVTGSIAFVAILLSFLLLRNIPAIRNLLIVLIIISVTIPLIIAYTKSIKKQKEKEEKFLEFVRDIVENVKAGTPISRSIINVRNRDYGTLKPHVLKLGNQISMGIPLTEAFGIFAKESKSSVISRSINLISEANRSGGEIDTILASVASSVNQTENIQKERKAAISNLIVQGYIIFFVFIMIVLVLEFFLMPLVANMGAIKDLNVSVEGPGESVDFSQAIFFLLIVQSFFSGLVIGKISEGKISSGVKHSFILVSLALILSSIGRVLFG